jgi:HD-GYP domain-containing protein (c-di-GMP phosphodiesterase class II)
MRAVVVGCAVVFAFACWVLVTRSGDVLGDRLRAFEQRRIASYADRELRPLVLVDGRVAVNSAAARRLRRAVDDDEGLHSLQVWNLDGRLVFATDPAERRSAPAQVNRGLLAALSDGDPLLESSGGTEVVAVPLRRDGKLVGAVVARADASDVSALVSDARRETGAIGAAALLVALAGVALVAVVVGRRLTSQGDELDESSHELFASYQELERGSLEAMATLNATVEAKDPYTAGHSERVRRVSLAIGRELNLTPRRLGALGTAALFHDVGKIAVPDEILTKEGDLSPVEFEILSRHAARGAEIVGNLSRLHDAVPLVRHHHERWDGRGYPDSLAGQSIPVEASIIAVADAWDAMTTSRPYRRALPIEHALSQLEAGRGTQFSPRVVDAFLAVAHEHPEDVAAPVDVARLVAVG